MYHRVKRWTSPRSTCRRTSYHRPDNLLDEYEITFEGHSRIFVDDANPSFIAALKDRVDEDPEYDKQIAFYNHNYPSVYDLEFLEQNMFVIPVPFNKEHKHMLADCKWGR